MSSLYCTKLSKPSNLAEPISLKASVLNIWGVGDAIPITGLDCKRGSITISIYFGEVVMAECCGGFGSGGSGACSEASNAAIALAISVDDRRANLAAHGSDLSAHLAHGTRLSQPVFALAQLRQAMGVGPARVGIDAGGGRDGSIIS